MSRSPIALAVLLATASLHAQTQHALSPDPIYATAEGWRSTSLFGAAPSSRHQRIDGYMKGRPMRIKAISYRPDFANGGSMGRSWSRTEVVLAAGNASSVSATFASNLQAPVRTFRGKLSWPTQPALPSKLPADWNVEIPFTTPYAHDGKLDLVVDVTMDGGTLANSAPWPATLPYHLDTWTSGTGTQSDLVDLGGHGSQGCIPAGNSSGAQATSVLEAWGPGGGSLSNKSSIRFSLRNGPKSSSVVYAVGLQAVPGGLTIPGITCNKLHFDPSKDFVAMAATTARNGATGLLTMGLPNQGIIDYDPVLAGEDAVCQAIWVDSRGALQLSSAGWSSLPATPFTSSNPLLHAVHAPSATASTGTLATNKPALIPLVRYHY